MKDLESLLIGLSSGDDERAEAAVRQLPDYGKQAIPKLKEMLLDPTPDTRWWATYAISHIKDTQVPPLLVEKLRDEQPEVRQCAALALRQQPDPRAIPELIEALADTDPVTANLAAAALTAIGEEAVPGLLEVLENGSWASRLEALRALAKIGDPRSIPALMQALEKDSALMEHWANEGLERMGVGMAFFKT